MAIPHAPRCSYRLVPVLEQGAAGREVPADRRARAALRLQPEMQRLRQDPAAARPAGASGCRSSARSRRSRNAGAPMVSIAGGEPLMHPQIDVMVNELVKRKKYVYLCTNAELVRKRWDKFNFKPSPYFAFAIHIDGLQERHDESVAKEGVFDEAVEAIKFLKEKGFRVTTNSTFFNTDTPQNDHRRAELPQRRGQGRPDDDLAGVRVREGARPGPLPRCDRDARAVHEGVRRRQPQAVAPEPLAVVPRLPRGQGRLRVHRVGHPVVLAARAGSGPAT